MDKPSLDAFLHNIGYTQPPVTNKEYGHYTAAVLKSLSPENTYKFIVKPKLPTYQAPSVHPTDFPNRLKWRQHLIDARKKWTRENLKPFFEFQQQLNYHRIPEDNLILGFLLPLTLTASQANQIKINTGLVETVIADHPRVVFIPNP